MGYYDTEKDEGASKVEAVIPKIVPQPNWKSFTGFSYLFDNPGSPIITHEDHKHISMISIGNLSAPGLELYEALDTAAKEMDPEILASNFNLFLLPSSTYHVTVWDGLNINNIENLSSSPIYNQFIDYFKDAFKSSAENWPPLSAKLDFGNRFENIGTIRFKFNALQSRGDTVLVADLIPADQESNEQLYEIIEKRKELDKRFEGYGKRLNADLRPHVAIGYFADKALARKAKSQRMDEWRRLFLRETSDCIIEFNGISLYAFTDMVTYFKTS